MSEDRTSEHLDLGVLRAQVSIMQSKGLSGTPIAEAADEIERLRLLESAYVRSEEECEHLHSLLDRVEELMRAEEHWGLREILAERGIRRFGVLRMDIPSAGEEESIEDVRLKP